MCGICGILGNNRARINNMIEKLNHRGPDDRGIIELDNKLSLGMTRLAVIDLTKKAHQPMSCYNKLIWIVFNGEIYNYKSERDILIKKGYEFDSSSDTEVILKMYEEYGDDFLLRLRGMFAFAIYDKRKGSGKERLLLARDHFGIKPLLYSFVGSNFIFSSEMKSILASGLIERQFNPEALRMLLTYGYIPQPMTAITNVKMLLPGHKMVIERGKSHIERYWKLDIDRMGDIKNYSYEDQVSYLKEAIIESANLQLVSDVPLGAFLSGGVDSSLLVAIMSQLCNKKIKTFSIGFGSEGKNIDETDDARKIADFIGTDHTREVVNGNDLSNNIDHIIYALDQPSVDGINSYFVSKIARKHVTVALSGTGGDELFAGYPWFFNLLIEFNKNNILDFLKRGYKRIFLLSFFDSFYSGKYATKIENLRSKSNFVSRYMREYQIFGTLGNSRILSKNIRPLTKVGREPYFDVKHLYELNRGSTISKTTGICLRTYTQNQLLRDIDAVSMSHSLEVRVPFLDPKIADIALSLPDNTKIKDPCSIIDRADYTYENLGVKKILIDAGKNLLPKNIAKQKKRGFGMPFEHWLKNELKDIFEDTVSDKSIKKRDFFDIEEVKLIKNNFYNNQLSWPYPWLLFITELWCRKNIDI